MKTRNNFFRTPFIGSMILILFLSTFITYGQVYYPSDDSYIRGGPSANINYGTEAVLVIKKGTVTDFYRKTYLKFNLAGTGITGLQSAKIRMYAATVDPFTVSVYETGDDWTESTINWSNAPAFGNLISSSQVSTAGLYYEWDITQYVLNQLNGDEIVSLACYDGNSANKQISFNSKEASTNFPELVMVSEASFLPPIAPANLEAVAASWKQINMRWADSSNNERYFIIERKSNSGTFAAIDSTPSNYNHYADTGLIEKTNYEYRVFAFNDIGSSSYSNEVSVLTKAFVPAPLAPGLFTGTTEIQQFGFSWADNSSNEDGFVVERKPENGFYIEVGWPGQNTTEWSNALINGLPSPVMEPDTFLTPKYSKVKTVSGVRFADVTDYKGKKIPLYMDIYQPDPDTTRNRPVIMFIHGGGFRTGSSRTQSYIVRYCQDFAKRGYVCVSIDYRLRDGSDMPTQASEFPALQDATRDANMALYWLRAHATEYGFDPNLMFLAGGSSGGRIGITLAYFDGPDETDPSANWNKSGIIALADLWGSLEPEMRAWAFPANELDIPTCIIHGTADSTILFQNSLDLAAELARADVSYEIHPIEGAGHTPTGASTDPMIEKWMAEFFVKEWKKHIASLKNYTYRICSSNDGGYSLWSEEVTLTVPSSQVNTESVKSTITHGESDFWVVINPDKSIDLFFRNYAQPANPVLNFYNMSGQKIVIRSEIMDDRIRIYPFGIFEPQMYLVSVNAFEHVFTGKVFLTR